MGSNDWFVSKDAATGTTPHAISEYRSIREWRIMRGSRRRGSGKWRRSVVEKGEGRLVANGEAENTVVSLSTSNSLYSLARSLASSIIIRPLCPPAISAALSPSTMSTWHSPSRSHTLLTHPIALSFNHKAHRRRTRSRGSSALPRRRGCTLTVSLFVIQMRDD